MREINQIYYQLCRSLVMRGERVGNTRELLNVTFSLHNIEDNVIGIRDISKKYLFGEMLWYFTARNDLEFISKFSSFWNHLSDDGKTCNSAYGYIAKKKFNFDQIHVVIDLLKKDPESRRGIININSPNPNRITTKDEPCTIALQFYIRDGKLHCTGMMRSNDIWFGLTYDVTFFTELQKYIADKIGVGYGTYTHFATSLHLYDRDYEKVKAIVEDPHEVPIKFNSHNFHQFRKLCPSMVMNADEAETMMKAWNIFEEE